MIPNLGPAPVQRPRADSGTPRVRPDQRGVERARQRVRRRRWIAAALLACYVIGLAFVALWPTPVDSDVSPQLAHVLKWLHQHGIPAFFDYSFVERSANVLLFVPAGLLLALLMARHRWWLALAICVVGSCLIELGQLLLLPARYATLDDVVMNSLGALIGVGVAAFVTRRS
ncbi:MAG: VanZ family protein [Pseudoclavibacter sp.]